MRKSVCFSVIALMLLATGCIGGNNRNGDSESADKGKSNTPELEISNGGKITITTEGEGDDVYIDGKYVGKSPYKAITPYGHHTAYAIRNEKRTKERSFDVFQGRADTIALSFKTITYKSYFNYDNRTGYLYSIVDGEKIKIDESIDGSYEILLEEDFDGNGLTDAVVRCSYGLGLSFLLPLQFVSANSDGTFTLTEPLGDLDRTDPECATINGKKVVYVGRDGYSLKNGVCTKVSTRNMGKIIAEWKFDSDKDYEYGDVLLKVDLDENGVMDQVIFYDIWRGIRVCLKINGNYLSDGCWDIIGSVVSVLSKKTNGYHDIMVDDGRILKWNGQTYE